MMLQNSSYGELYSSIGNCFLSPFSSCADRRLKRESEKKKRSLCWIRKCEIPVIGRPLSRQLILPGTFLWISSVRDATDETNRPRRPCHHCQKKNRQRLHGKREMLEDLTEPLQINAHVGPICSHKTCNTLCHICNSLLAYGIKRAL